MTNGMITSSLKLPVTGIQFKFFSFLLTLFSATWLISNIAAVKMVSVWGVIFTGGFIVFPMTSMLNSIIAEAYGYKNARQAIWAGFILNVSYVFFINLVNVIPAAPHWGMSQQFKSILVPETRIIIASLISFILSDFINSYLIARMKLKSKGLFLYKRIIIASVIALSVDIVCFIFIAFYKILPGNDLVNFLMTVYAKKMVCQIVLLPFVFYLIKLVKKREGVDIYDYDTKFNPFLFDNVYDLNANKLASEENFHTHEEANVRDNQKQI
ncbi:MAG: hypothetical protein K0S27_1685 [Gammaproteobacteria bacterium]|jgi:uncharacterized integral membrane protein (TIGR00697 family)|nr:hypothetical protein [Gammaproteobacteria bacterium]